MLDDKAVFSVSDDVAEANNVMRTFTLGRGQKYGGLTSLVVGRQAGQLVGDIGPGDLGSKEWDRRKAIVHARLSQEISAI